jgi:hypothetical protein
LKIEYSKNPPAMPGTSKGATKMSNNNLNGKGKRYPREKVFIVNESYAGIKSLSDIFADLLYSAYCERESDASGKELNHNGCLPAQTGQTHYGGGEY